jgi:valacyclovir hydrolase
MPTLQLPDQTIYYEVLGPAAGAPVLLMHGWLNIGRDLLALANSLTAAGYRVILPDLPGYGHSVPPDRTFPPDFYRRDALCMGRFLDVLGLSGVHVMGFSDGGEVALLLAIVRPDVCRSVTAWGAIGAYSKELGAYVREKMPRLTITPGHRARHPGQRIEAWQPAWIEAFSAIVAAGGDISLSRAADIACPLFLMVGEHDRLNPVDGVWQFVQAATRPGGPPRHFKVFAGAEHPIHDQRPDQFVAAVLEFLKQT